MLFPKLPTDSLTNNIVESLKVSLIKKSFHNRIYENNPLNSNSNYLHCYGDQRFITRRLIYPINDYIVEMLNNGWIVEV